jgi:hypothetical protein
MRLNGKAAIMRYLGKAPSNRWAWAWIAHRYADAIRTVSFTGAWRRGYWCRSEDIDSIDLKAPTLRQSRGDERLTAGVAAGRAVYEKAKEAGVLRG